MKKLLFLCCFVPVTLTSLAQTGYRIEATIQGIRDSTCFLAHYLDKQHSLRDTAKVDAQGKLVFEGKEPLPQGLYVISIGHWRYFDLVVADDQQFTLRTDTTNFITSMKVEGSRENELFYAFNQAMQQRFDQIRTLQAAQKAGTDPSAPAKMAAIQKEMNEYRRQFIQTNQGTFTATLFNAATEPEIPPAPRLANGRPDSLFAYRYYKAHYFDHFNLADERLLRTPLMAPKIERYFSDLVVQEPDSLSKEADLILSKVPKDKKELRKYLIYKMTGPYESAKVLGTENFFVHMGEKYYLGEPGLYDSSTVRRFRERIATMKPTLTGQKIPNMVLSDTLGRSIPLYNVKAAFTVVFIYDPECGHCREATPQVKEFYQKHKSQGVAIYAANLKRDPDQWKKFIREFKTQSFINGMDLVGQVDFWRTFDANTTPTILILDASKKIIARHLPATELEQFWAYYQRQRPVPVKPAVKPTGPAAKPVVGKKAVALK